MIMTCTCVWALAPAKDEEVVDVDILNLLVGILLLFLGRRIFWLFVGGVGFVAAIDLVSRLAMPWPTWLTLVVALAAGLVGALLAILLQEVAVGIAGFLAGGYIVLHVPSCWACPCNPWGLVRLPLWARLWARYWLWASSIGRSSCSLRWWAPQSSLGPSIFLSR